MEDFKSNTLFNQVFETNDKKKLFEQIFRAKDEIELQSVIEVNTTIFKDSNWRPLGKTKAIAVY